MNWLKFFVLYRFLKAKKLIPTTIFRRVAFLIFAVAVASTMILIATAFASTPEQGAVDQTLAALLFIVAFYAGTPIFARFLVPQGSVNSTLQARLRNVLESIPNPPNVVLYEHIETNAVAVGILPTHSRIYLTSGIMNVLSDTGLIGILAHEQTHISEHHVLFTLLYACTYALVAEACRASRG